MIFLSSRLFILMAYRDTVEFMFWQKKSVLRRNLHGFVFLFYSFMVVQATDSKKPKKTVKNLLC